MFRPERMTSVSVICLARDLDKALEGLNQFGQFHVEEQAEAQTEADYSQALLQVEEAATNVNALIAQLKVEKSSLTDIFRGEEPARTQVTSENWASLAEEAYREISALKSQAEELNQSLGTVKDEAEELLHAQSVLATLEALGADLEAMEDLRLIRIEIGSAPKKCLPEIEKSLSRFPLILHHCFLSSNRQFMCTAFPTKYAADVEKTLKTCNVQLFQVPEGLPHNVTLALREVKGKLGENATRQKKLEAALKSLAKQNGQWLLSLREITHNVQALLEAKQKIIRQGRLAIIRGFVPKNQVDALHQNANATLGEAVLIVEHDLAPSADPPTRFRNSRFVKPFEEITKLYGRPHYDELDPTPVIAITFPLIFGLMFGDVGHGLLLLIGGLTLGSLVKHQQGIKNFCYIFAACGVGAVVAGLLFGEFFGIRLFAPLWFSPFDNVLQFLIFSLLVGVIQIESGLVLELANFWLKHDFVDVLLTSVPKIAFYAGSVYLIAAYQLNFAMWANGPILLPLVPFFVLVFGKAIASRVWGFSAKLNESPKEGNSLAERLFESGDLVIRLLSNTVSYTRILALLMAHWALILVAYTIAGLLSSSSPWGIVLGGVVVVFGNLFVLALEGLIVFIHSIRLHFYEWFSKFYLGTGTPFMPFQHKFEHTQIVLKEKQAET
jgi:V/A-type H+/Na+-transporting ATPase subunit I